jgi:hypothetical protein
VLVDLVIPGKLGGKAREAGKTWNEVKRLTANRTRWRSFTDALCSRRGYRNE